MPRNKIMSLKLANKLSKDSVLTTHNLKGFPLSLVDNKLILGIIDNYPSVNIYPVSLKNRIFRCYFWVTDIDNLPLNLEDIEYFKLCYQNSYLPGNEFYLDKNFIEELLAGKKVGENINPVLDYLAIKTSMRNKIRHMENMIDYADKNTK